MRLMWLVRIMLIPLSCAIPERMGLCFLLRRFDLRGRRFWRGEGFVEWDLRGEGEGGRGEGGKGLVRERGKNR